MISFESFSSDDDCLFLDLLFLSDCGSKNEDLSLALLLIEFL